MSEISFKVSDEDKSKLKKLADEERLSLGAFCRSKLIKSIKKEEVSLI